MNKCDGKTHCGVISKQSVWSQNLSTKIWTESIHEWSGCYRCAYLVIGVEKIDRGLMEEE